MTNDNSHARNLVCLLPQGAVTENGVRPKWREMYNIRQYVGGRAPWAGSGIDNNS